MEDEFTFKGKKLVVEFSFMPREGTDVPLSDHIKLSAVNSCIEIDQVWDEAGKELDPKSAELEGLDEFILQDFLREEKD
jgi:hypothetical protein